MVEGKEKWLTDNGLLMLRCWARDGLTKQEIAERMGINRKTLWEWSKLDERFEQAMSEGREVIDYKVENALLTLALGGIKKIIKTVISGNQDKDGNRQTRIEKTEEDILPNVTAVMCWLNNKKPEQWRRNRDNMLELNDEDANVTVNIIRHEKGSDGKTKIVKPKGNKLMDGEDNEDWTINSNKESHENKSNVIKEVSDEEKEWLGE